MYTHKNTNTDKLKHTHTHTNTHTEMYTYTDSQTHILMHTLLGTFWSRSAERQKLFKIPPGLIRSLEHPRLIPTLELGTL